MRRIKKILTTAFVIATFVVCGITSSAASSSKTYVDMTNFTSLPSCTSSNSNKQFVGWNTKADGTGTWLTTSTAVSDTNGKTYYAVFRAIKWKHTWQGDKTCAKFSSHNVVTDSNGIGYCTRCGINAYWDGSGGSTIDGPCQICGRPTYTNYYIGACQNSGDTNMGYVYCDGSASTTAP